MNSKAFRIISYSFLLVVGTYFLFLGLFQAKGFLIPLSMGIFLSLVMLPVASWLEKKGISRGLAVLISDLLILGFCAVVVFIISLQVYQIANDWPEYEKKLQPKYEQALEYVSDKSGADVDEIKNKMQDSIKKAGESSANEKGIASKMFSFFGNFLLVFVYIFFLMYYRNKIKNSILSFVAEEKRDKARKIINQAGNVTQQYLFGRFILILVLAILYTAGLLILGLKQAVLIAFIAALLSLVPYIGNLVGFGIAVLMGVLTGDGAGIIIGITIVFAIAQFVESYILEPFVVGEKVDLNPTLTIIGVVMFGMVWGLAGMFLAIPFMGILKAISDNVPVLKPIGYTLGTEDISTESGWIKKIKNWFVKKKKKTSRS
jgi:predicted PurR-regulated permease PerM